LVSSSRTAFFVPLCATRFFTLLLVTPPAKHRNLAPHIRFIAFPLAIFSKKDYKKSKGFHAPMNSYYRGIVYSVAFVLLGVYGYFTLRGPQGVPALLEKRRQVRQLEEENANLIRENENKRERIRKLNESASQQEIEIRDKLKKLRPGETEFILPEPAKQSAPQQPTGQ
jgi:cell division protein FtsB